MTRGTCGLAVALWMVAFGVFAEVRILRDASGTPTLSVHLIANEVWTARGVLSDAVINPEGDTRGDGLPGSAAWGRYLLVAWASPSTQSLTIMQDTGLGTRHFANVPLAAPSFGTPLVRRVGSGWLIATQVLTPAPRVVVVVASSTAVEGRDTLLSGQLLDVLVVGDTAHVLAYSQADKQVEVLTSSVWVPIPGPVPEVPARIDLRLAPRAADGSGTKRKDPLINAPCIAPTDDGYILAWSMGNGQIGRVFIDQLSISEREIVEGPNGSCQAVLIAAQRD